MRKQSGNLIRKKTERKYMISVKNTERFSQNARQRENV